MSNIAILPARGGSKRIVNKNIIDFLGRPIISYAIETLQDSNLFDTIHVSTDNPDIAKISEDVGADTRFVRPYYMSGDHTTMLDSVRWVLNKFADNGQTFDSVAVVFPCAVLMQTSDIDGGLKAYNLHGGKLSIMTVVESPSRIERHHRINNKGILEPINKDYLNTRTQDLPQSYYETGMFTIHSCSKIINNDKIDYLGHIIPQSRAVDIDTIEDLRFAELLYKVIRG